jgi:hypothetical protein
MFIIREFSYRCQTWLTAVIKGLGQTMLHKYIDSWAKCHNPKCRYTKEVKQIFQARVKSLGHKSQQITDLGWLRLKIRHW